ncbi:PRC-barrel domain-containing protein [Candidatus Saccharibacteria bacterium]|nr:PRC-barrel domain-containing protein [Candidatus Saccharibacteria bacterium]
MLQLSGSYTNKQVLSLRTGGPVGTILSTILNPNNLKIEGFYCSDKFSKSKLILLSQEIRDVIEDGIVVDDHEAMSDPQDLVRLKKVVSLNFDLLGKKVITTSKQNLGKINDYAVDTESMYVQKLYVAQPLVKSLQGGQLSIDRSQIVEITDKKIVVNDPTVLVEDGRTTPSPAIA